MTSVHQFACILNVKAMTMSMTMSNNNNNNDIYWEYEEEDCSNVNGILVVSNNNILQLVWERLMSSSNNCTSSDNDNPDTSISCFNNNTNPIQQCVLLCLFVSILTFVVSTVTKNYSQVDKLWSILPWIYTWILTLNCDGGSPTFTFSISRPMLMSCVATIWGIRLTYNFHRRGGYNWPKVWTGEEDYRWKILQQGKFMLPILSNKYVWNIFNLIFISLYQNILLLWIVTPSMVAYIVEEETTITTALMRCSNHTSTTTITTASSLNVFDYLATILCLTCILIETIADNQQYQFQSTKYKYKLLKDDGKKKQQQDLLQQQFNTSGLFSICRKPNYAAEQLLWISFYLYSVAALYHGNNNIKDYDSSSSSSSSSFFSYSYYYFSSLSFLFNWSISGCVMLCLLFQGSGWFTEKITLSKYPKYKEYMKRTPLYIPNNPMQIWRTFMISSSTNTSNKTKAE